MSTEDRQLIGFDGATATIARLLQKELIVNCYFRIRN